jgi:hypothetical protein
VTNKVHRIKLLSAVKAQQKAALNLAADTKQQLQNDDAAAALGAGARTDITAALSGRGGAGTSASPGINSTGPNAAALCNHTPPSPCA